MEKLHLIKPQLLPIKDWLEFENESQTDFHKTFYNRLNSNWVEFMELYESFIFNEIYPQFDENNETYAEAPLIKCSSDGSIESFRFSNQLMQMIDPAVKGLKEFYKAYHDVSERVHRS